MFGSVVRSGAFGVRERCPCMVSKVAQRIAQAFTEGTINHAKCQVPCIRCTIATFVFVAVQTILA